MSFSPIMWLVRGMLWMAGMGVLVIMLASSAVHRWDNHLYDAHLKHWRYSSYGDVVIIAIDPKSLNALGRWPWPRSDHAMLIDRLREAGVRGIGVDVIVSSEDVGHPEQNQLLAASIHRAGNVVLPISAEAIDLGGPLQESLPTSALVGEAAAVGHVDVATDDGDVVRSAYLKAGLGQAYWPSFALALFDLDHKTSSKNLPGLGDPQADHVSPYLWMRDHYVLLRYAGPAGTFGRLSYVDVLRGEVPTDLLKGRWVLIGATAVGLGDNIQTPYSIMPGVEYQANVLESLQHGWLVTPLGFLDQLVLGGGMLAVPLLLYGLPGFRQAWRAALCAGVLMVALSVCLLRIAYIWWPPSACLGIVALEFALYSVLAWRQRRARAAAH